MGRGPAKRDAKLEVAVAAFAEALADPGEQVVQRLGDEGIERGDGAGGGVREVKAVTAADVEFPIGGTVQVDGAGDEFDGFEAKHTAEKGGEGDLLGPEGVLELGQGDGGGAAEQGREHGAAAGGEAQAARPELGDEIGEGKRVPGVGHHGGGAGVGRRAGGAGSARREGVERCG